MKMNLEKIMTLWHPYAKTFFLHSVFTHFAVAQYRMHLGRDNKSKLFFSLHSVFTIFAGKCGLSEACRVGQAGKKE